jgi:hypothetical protein
VGLPTRVDQPHEPRDGGGRHLHAVHPRPLGDGAGGGDIFWYAPGTATDTVWDFIDGVRFPFRDPVSGTYRPMSGDYLGDGLDDVVWRHSGGFHLWVHRPVTGGVGRFRYGVTFS